MSFRAIVSLLLVSCPLTAAALESDLEPMIGAELTWTHIEVADENFNPLAARVRLALALTPEWEIGVVGGAGVADDEEVTVTADISEFGEAYVRYSASLDDNARLVLSAGYGEMTLDVSSLATPGAPGAQTFSGVVWGVSLQERLSRYPHWIGSLDFERWFDEDDLTITTLSYGFRYAF